MDEKRKDGYSDFESYVILMNMLDDIALEKVKYSDCEDLINQLSTFHEFTPQIVGEANDAYGETWIEVIEKLKENFKTGNRI